jgi:formyltetrahydrofolate-dependent phosphoribosylglycinamide formyltransferase
MTTTQRPLRLAVLFSGGGRTLLNLHRHIAEGKLRAEIAVAVSSRGDAPGVQRARDAGLPIVAVERRLLNDDLFQERLTQTVGGADLVCMAGFLSLWRIPAGWVSRAINIHPALLPKFGGPGMFGRHVHEAVLAAKSTISGCTVHFCDNQYDHGPIILQRTVPVLTEDTPETLAARVFEQECIAYPEAIQLFADHRVELREGFTVIRR